MTARFHPETHLVPGVTDLTSLGCLLVKRSLSPADRNPECAAPLGETGPGLAKWWGSLGRARVGHAPRPNGAGAEHGATQSPGGFPGTPPASTISHPQLVQMAPGLEFPGSRPPVWDRPSQLTFLAMPAHFPHKGEQALWDQVRLSKVPQPRDKCDKNTWVEGGLQSHQMACSGLSR